MPKELISILIALAVVFAIAFVLGLVLALADKFLRVEEDKRIEEVTGMLAGANCGGCGYPGCAGLAAAVVNKEVDNLNSCRPTKPEAKEKIKQYLRETPGPDGSTINLK
ncbi:MAG: (Fe-S)-binding protein [Bacillales bacterium]|nr:(Fe-S)-binding protein [Bacillales bacterium]